MCFKKMYLSGAVYRGRKADHRAQLDELGVAAFDLVICNLYPFTQTVASGAYALPSSSD